MDQLRLELQESNRSYRQPSAVSISPRRTERRNGRWAYLLSAIEWSRWPRYWSWEPIFEADLQPEQYATGKIRSALDAVHRVYKLINTGHKEIVDADLSSYFDEIPHAELMRSIARRVVDGAMLHLLKMWLEAPVEETNNATWQKASKHPQSG